MFTSFNSTLVLIAITNSLSASGGLDCCNSKRMKYCHEKITVLFLIHTEYEARKEHLHERS